MKILALESSTSAAKAMLYDTDTSEARVVTRPYGSLVDGIRPDPAAVYNLSMAAGKEAAAGQKADLIALGATWHGVGLFTRSMEPAGPLLSWADTSAAGLCLERRKDPAWCKDFYQATGCTIHASYAFFKLLQLKKEGTDLRKYLIGDQGSYNLYRLTGHFATTACMASGTGYYALNSTAETTHSEKDFDSRYYILNSATEETHYEKDCVSRYYALDSTAETTHSRMTSSRGSYALDGAAEHPHDERAEDPCRQNASTTRILSNSFEKTADSYKQDKSPAGTGGSPQEINPQEIKSQKINPQKKEPQPAGSYHAGLLRELELTEDQLPEIAAWDQTFPLSPEGAEALGLQPGIPVLAANADGGLNQIGADGMEPGVMTFSMGTSAALRMTVPGPCLSPAMETWCYRSPLGYLAGAAVSGGCNCIDWLRQKLAPDRTYEELESTGPPSMDTPLFMPYLFGERSPGWDPSRLGSFFRLRGDHDIRDLYRAVQEGLLLQMYLCYETLTGTAGKPSAIRLSGGILRSETWMQMAADLFRRPIEIDAAEQSSLLGSVKTAALAAGRPLPPNRNRRLLQPDTDKAQLYQEKLELFRKYYEVEHV